MSVQNQRSSLPTQAYSEAFVSGRPKEAALLLQTRLRKAKVVNDEIADYFAARREIEEAYLKALGKISRKTFVSDPDALGSSLAPLVERLVSELSEIGSIHAELDTRIAEECEGPLRDANSNVEWGKARQHDESISSTLREINSLEAQLQKDQKKAEGTVGSKKASAASAKVAETERALAQAYEVWEMEAPFAFDAYQRMDQSRLELIRESIARFETVQSDAANRLTAATEKTIALALAFRSEDDMRDFISSSADAVQHQQGSAGFKLRGRRPDNTSGSATAQSAIHPVASLQEFGASTPSLASDLRSHSNGGPSAHAGRTSVGAAVGAAAGSTLKSAFSRFGRAKSSKESKDATLSEEGQWPEVLQPHGANGSYDAEIEDVSTPLASINTASNATKSNTQPIAAAITPTRVDADGFTIPPSDRQRAPWDIPQSESGQDSNSKGGFTSDTTTLANANNMSIGPGAAQASDPTSDAEALERVRSTLLTSGPAAPQRRNTTRRDRRDVRATTYNPTLPSDLDFGGNTATSSSGAGVRPVSQFGLLSTGVSGPSGARSPSSPASAIGNGTFDSILGSDKQRSHSIASQDSRNAIPNPFSSSSSGKDSAILGIGSADSAALQSSPSGQGGALRASIVETVSAAFTGAELIRLLVVGEISVSLRDVIALMPIISSATSPSQRVLVHIDSFEELEKAAPNPSFLAPVSEKPGEYTLDIQALLQAASTPNNGQVPPAAVLLKYQVHISDSSKSRRVPLSLHAQWRCEPHQTSLLITYGANPESSLAQAPTLPNQDAATAAMLSDLSIRVSVEPTSVTGVMSKPNGAWSAEQKRMLWTLPDGLALSISQPTAEGTKSGPQKVLARFQVDGAGTPQPVQARWRVAGRTLSSLGIRVVSEGNASESSPANAIHIAQVSRMTVAGKYIAQP